ncbi:hypothetical protein IFM89_022623 [Coptis chinensis]|uniref:Small acidic protein-like domain-containing protein n=1 Tax=Coptis chinensis TaxID=261450 RepID=A0A835HEZ1_9MAGN|nr:hypothetical protein IFM89_022623 [Coptis chinensis]
MDSGRNRFDKGGDSHRYSDRRSYRSSHDDRRQGDFNRYNKYADEGERSYHRSSGSGRESRSSTHSDRGRHGSDQDRQVAGWSTGKYAEEKSDDEEHRGKDKDSVERKRHKDKDSTVERATSGRRHINSYVDESKSEERERHKKSEGGRDETKNSVKSLGDDKSDSTSSVEEARAHGRHSDAARESGRSRREETQKSNMKDLVGQKGDTMGKRKSDAWESDRHWREKDEKECSTFRNRKSYAGDDQYPDKKSCFSEDNESSPKKLKLPNAVKDGYNGKDGQTLSKSTFAAAQRPPSSKYPQETIGKVIPEPVEANSNEAETAQDFNAAKVAAMKAAELVNKNLVGGGYMSTDQKKKLLWGSKKSAVAEEVFFPAHRWDVPLFSDRERQEKFNKLMGVKGEMKPEQKPDTKESGGLLQAEKQEQLQLDLEKQYTAGLRRRDGRTVGLGL